MMVIILLSQLQIIEYIFLYTYNENCFQKNLVAQTGDPTGTGRGGESMNG